MLITKNPHGEYQAFKFYGIHVQSKQILLASSSLNHILYSRSASQLFGTFYWKRRYNIHYDWSAHLRRTNNKNSFVT